jgi:hypothetical protein
MNPLNFFGGLIVVLLGLTLIATNAGWISTGVWWSIIMLWPVILVIIGLKLLFHGNDILFMWLALIVVLLSVAYVVAVNQGKWGLTFTERDQVNVGTNVYSESFTDKFDTSTVKKLSLTVGTGAAEVNLHALPTSTSKDVLYQVKTQDLGKLSINRTISKETVNLKVTESDLGLQVVPNTLGLKRQIDISLPSSLLLDLELSSGASKVMADFSTLMPENVKLSIGASSGEIVLSDRVARQTLIVNAGASDLTFKLPAGLGVKATFDGGLNNVNIDSVLGLTKSDDTYVTRDFSKAAKQLVFTGNVGVSSIKFLQK